MKIPDRIRAISVRSWCTLLFMLVSWSYSGLYVEDWGGGTLTKRILDLYFYGVTVFILSRISLPPALALPFTISTIIYTIPLYLYRLYPWEIQHIIPGGYSIQVDRIFIPEWQALIGSISLIVIVLIELWSLFYYLFIRVSGFWGVAR